MRRIFSVLHLLVMVASFEVYSADCFKLINRLMRAPIKRVVYPDSSKYKTLGLEIEGVIDSKHTFEDIAKSLKSLLIKDKYESQIINISSTEYGVQFRRVEGGEWSTISILEDSSIKEGINERGVEITSPIMRSKKDIKQHLSIIHHLKKTFNFKSVSSGGIHIHYGVKDLSLSSVLSIKKFYFMMNQQIISAVNFHSNRTLSGNAELREDITKLGYLRYYPMAKDAFSNYSQNNTLFKYSEKYETIENKIYNSSVDLRVISHYINQTVELYDTLINRPEFLETTTLHYNKNFRASAKEYFESEKDEEARVIGDVVDTYIQSLLDLGRR